MSGLDAQIRAITSGALPLATARYLREHPKARKRMPAVWLDEQVERWAARPVEEIAAEARHRLEVLDGWEQDAAGEPELLERWRLETLHARAALMAAASGAFGSATGPLADVLERAGESPRRLHFS